jgi:hypothetical protein
MIYDGIKFQTFSSRLPDEFTLVRDLPIDYYNIKDFNIKCFNIKCKLDTRSIRTQLLDSLSKAKFKDWYQEYKCMSMSFSNIGLVLIDNGNLDYLSNKFREKINTDIIVVEVRDDIMYF